MKKILITLSLLFPSFVLAEYTPISPATDDGITFSIDFKTLQRKNNLVRFWIKDELSTPQKLVNENFSSVIGYQEYDCSEKRFRYLSRMFYEKNNAQGRMIFNNTMASEWFFIPPNTVGSSILNIVCKNK
jgi:hypothetical protein